MTTTTILDPQGGLSAAVLEQIKTTITRLSDELHDIQQVLHNNPELAWEEKIAHDTATAYMETKGFKVTRGAYGFPTAWEAVFDNGDGPTVGFNSEMDALRGIGHACGHNLICIVGIGAAIGCAEFMKTNNIPGKIVLLGTPAEEAGGGKSFLVKKGAYDNMDICMMTHPMGQGNGAGIPFCSCAAGFSVKFKGASAHAAAHPDKGVNALDAAVSAYTNVALLRQQIPDSHRIYLTIKGSEGWSANVIPANSEIQIGIRAPTASEAIALIPRALNCVKAAALATGCEVDIRREIMYLDTCHSDELCRYLGEACSASWGLEEYTFEPDFRTPGSTDFGDVCYRVPAMHPFFRLPDMPKNEAPHSDSYAKYSGTRSATDAAVKSAAGIAFVGVRALVDAAWLKTVRESWEKQMSDVDAPTMLKRLDALMQEFKPGTMATAPCCHDDH